MDYSCKLDNVCKKLKIKWQRKESPYIVGMFLLLYKIDMYIENYKYYKYYKNEKDKELYSITYNNESSSERCLTGTGSKSIMYLSQNIILTEEEILCIRYFDEELSKESSKEFLNACIKYNTVYITNSLFKEFLIEKTRNENLDILGFYEY